MKTIYSLLCTCMITMFITGCSVFGVSNVDTAPYTVLEKQGELGLRHYEKLVLVTTQMPDGMDSQREGFSALFDYISGQNNKDQEISMTAPVFMDQDNSQMESMSFVLPSDFTVETAPAPENQNVKLQEIKDYTVATITFSGLLQKNNIEKHKSLLREWIKEQGYETIGAAKIAGYNPPFTIPALRKNEILIPVKKPM